MKLPCDQCNGDGFVSFGDRHVENRKESCATCGGTGEIEARTGETPESSAPLAIPTEPFKVHRATAGAELHPDPVVEAVRADLLRRSQFGLAKYGTPLSRTDLSVRDWAQHAYEEALDFANYLKRLIMELDGQKAAAPVLPTPVIDVQRMGLSGGRADYFVRIRCGGREQTLFKLSHRHQAQYTADELCWLLGLREEKPELLAYDHTTHPDD